MKKNNNVTCKLIIIYYFLKLSAENKESITYPEFEKDIVEFGKVYFEKIYSISSYGRRFRELKNDKKLLEEFCLSIFKYEIGNKTIFKPIITGEYIFTNNESCSVKQGMKHVLRYKLTNDRETQKVINSEIQKKYEIVEIIESKINR